MKKTLALFLLTFTILPSCGANNENSWSHYQTKLPGTIKNVKYGTREFWQKGSNFQFTKPDGSIVEKEMSSEMALSFEYEDPRKIISKTNLTISYGLQNKIYAYHTNEEVKGYRLLNSDDLEKDGEDSYRVLVKNDSTPAVYSNVLFATAVINNEENFNKYCWANDHDVFGYYVLGNDINYIKTVSSSSTSEQNNYSFLGTLDGRYQTIDTISVSNNILGMFGCSLQSKIIEGVKYSPTIKYLTIKNVEGQNRIFGERLNDLDATQLNVSQGNGAATADGLLANVLGSNNSFKKCSFSFRDTMESPCLFVDRTGTDNAFSSTTIDYVFTNTKVIKNDETSGPNGSISGITWKAAGDISLSCLSGKSINTIGKEPLEYLSVVDDPATDNDEIAEYLYPRQTHNTFQITGVEISFSTTKTVKYPLTINVSSNKEMTEVMKTITINSSSTNKATIYNLIPNKTYYYQISDSSTETKKSLVDSFNYASPVRGIYNDLSIRNMRDIGGWMTESGKPINYGLVYRSATWEGLSTGGADILQNELGIKNEVDLRFDKSARQHTFTQFNFIKNGLTDAYENMFKDTNTINNIKNLFNNILSDKNSYPLCYHCSAGADRTGLCSLLIEGCLGVSDEDIYRDYELTTFYQGNRARADIILDNGVYYFRKDGGRSDFWHENGFKQLLETNLKSYYTESGKVCDAITNFLKTKCSITDATIQQVRDILISK